MFADRYYYRRHPVVWVLIIYLLLLAVSWPWLVTQPSALQGQIGQTAMLNGTVRESRNGLSYLWLYPEMRNDRGHQKQELIYVVLPQPWDGEEPEQNTIWYPAGSQLQITGLLELPEPQRNPGGFSEQNWLRSKGARLRLVAEHVEVLQPPRGIWQCVYQLQQNLHRKAQQYLSSEQQGIAMALLLGEKQGLDQNFYRLTQRMGIAHIFAVSGLHVGFMGALLLWLFRLMGLERSWLSFLFLAAVLVFYCMAVGLPASALRATGMLLLAALALRLQRPSAPLDFLALTQELGVPLWVRHVVIPGLTDGEAHIRALARMAGQFHNLQKVELLGFRKLCLEKYGAMGVPFPLADTPEMDAAALCRLEDAVRRELPDLA